MALPAGAGAATLARATAPQTAASQVASGTYAHLTGDLDANPSCPAGSRPWPA